MSKQSKPKKPAPRKQYAPEFRTEALALAGRVGIPVWRWESPAFGDAAPSLQLRTVNLRFPGQYFDAETGLHQNWNRDYDPSIGRYVQPDPIGLVGGVDAYGYVVSNPLRFVDPFGLVYGLGRGPYSQFSEVKRTTQDTMVPNKSIGEIFGKNCVEICQIDVVVIGAAVDVAIGLIPNATMIRMFSNAVAATASVGSTSISLASCVTEC